MAVSESSSSSTRAQRTRVLPTDKRTAGSGEKTSGRRPRAKPADDPLSSNRVRYLVDAFGGRTLAALTGVSASQPTRWSVGDERPGATAAPLLIDLEHVLAKARLIWGEVAAQRWLISANVYLEGARPIDVLRLRGASAVLDALDAQMWGGAA